jgi:rhomboid protease GluP
VIPGIDNAAHVGGFVAGSLTAVVLVRPFAIGSELPRAGRLAALAALAAAVASLVLAVPPSRYRWHEELAAREQLSQFAGEDQRINSNWQQLLREGEAGKLSFEQLAGRVDSEITDKYDQTFEQLSSLRLPAAAPSAAGVDAARRYVELRRQASRDLAEGLRQHDRKQIREALDLARRAPGIAEGSSKRSGRAER